jgi:hypothetical protein
MNVGSMDMYLWVDEDMKIDMYVIGPAPASDLMFFLMKRLQPDDQIVKIDEALGIAWVLLPPDETLGGFQGISPRVMDEERFLSAKKKAEEKKGKGDSL